MSVAAAQAAIDQGGIPATFGAGCFWGTERYFKKNFGAMNKPGSALMFHGVGYMAGELEGQNPTNKPFVTSPGYRAVCTGTTGLAEVLHVVYNPKLISYEALCLLFLRMHNPTTHGYQGNDKGTQYRSTIMVHNEDQRSIANKLIAAFDPSKTEVVEIGSVQVSPENREKFYRVFGENRRIVSSIEPATAFFPAEDYHQDYLEANPDGYCNHRMYW